MSRRIELRDYQRECIDAIGKAGDGRHLIVMATGLGKTVTFANIPRHGRMLILSHRDELVRQPVKYFACPVGVEQAREHSHGEPVVSASVQTLSRRNRLERFEPGEFDMIITDEAHHATADGYRRIIDRLRPRVHLGFTATPNRADGVGLEECFDDIIFQRDLKWGIRHGWLTDVECRRIVVDWNMSLLKTRFGDYSQQSLGRMLADPSSDDSVVDAIQRLRRGQTIVFAGSVEHARRLAGLMGDQAHVIDGTTPRDERRRLIDAFTKREYPILINYGVFTEGVDLPLIETVIVARPTRNESLYQQMIGRGLRPAPGKTSLMLVDIVGASNDNKLVTAPSLYGIDYQPDLGMPEELFEGSLDGMPARVDAWESSCPAGWVIRTMRADPLGLDVAWIIMADGTRRIMGRGYTATMSKPDPLGRVNLTCEQDDDKLELAGVGEHVADGRAYEWLASHAAKDDNLWDSSLVSRWADQPATQAQLDRIRRTYTAKELEGVPMRALSKRMAAMLASQRPAPATPRQLDYLRSIAKDTTLLDGVDVGSLDSEECSRLIDRAKQSKLPPRIADCPACGAPVRATRNGAWRCDKTTWVKTGGRWTVRGCGFQIDARQIQGNETMFKNLLTTGRHENPDGTAVERVGLVKDRNGVIHLRCEHVKTDKPSADESENQWETPSYAAQPSADDGKRSVPIPGLSDHVGSWEPPAPTGVVLE